ncbi:MAG: DNA-directed RNA polymerase subunit D [Candidatus Diapherotrites archaeon]|nr:DNA-directed RNA polymerase subunit D [Candidatus Diapherotrites archaeon]
MEIKKISEENGILKLLIKDLDLGYMNAIRRTVMEEIPVLAMETIRIYENNSIIFDEFLAHRLGMLPIISDVKEYKKGDIAKFMVDKKGPCTVYSQDIIPVDPKTEIATKNIPLTKLKEGQSVKMEMDALAGTGKMHTKFQPGIVAYTQLPKIKQMKGKPEKVVQAHSTGLLEVKYNKVMAKNAYDWTPSDYEEIMKDSNLEIEFEENSFVVNVETSGAMENIEILNAAIDVLNEKVEEFRKEIAKI